MDTERTQRTCGWSNGEDEEVPGAKAKIGDRGCFLGKAQERIDDFRAITVVGSMQAPAERVKGLRPRRDGTDDDPLLHALHCVQGARSAFAQTRPASWTPLGATPRTPRGPSAPLSSPLQPRFIHSAPGWNPGRDPPAPRHAMTEQIEEDFQAIRNHSPTW